MSERPIERVRRICLSLPEAIEKKAWGEPTFRIRNKLFAMFASANTHHGEGKHALWCPAPEGIQGILVQAEPSRFYIPPYVGKSGWIGIYLDHIEDLELEIHVREAYCLVAPKKIVTLLEADGVRKSILTTAHSGRDPS